MTKFIILILLVGGGYYFYSSLPHNATELHGTWRVLNDPDNPNSRETFELTERGRFIIPNGLNCGYALTGSDNLSIGCDTKRGKRVIDFSISDDRSVLTNPSGTTYIKVD